MKQILLCGMALTLMATACKKDDSNTNASTADTWYINGTGHSAIAVQMIGTGMTATSATSTSFTAYFSAIPTENGAYKISNMSLSGSKSVYIGVGANSKSYSTLGYEGNANVTLNGGKITITVPEIYVKNTMGSDSVRFSGSMTQR